MTMIIEKEAAQSWHDMQRAIDELNSNGNEIPVYRAALTLPLTQAGITAVVGAIAEYPSGFTLFLLNTGGAGEVFLICAIDGIWRVWTVTPSSGGMPLIDPATPNNFALQNVDGSLYDAGFGAGAFDAAGSAATVQDNLDTHTGLTGTAVHGLGTASTEAETAFARLAGRAGGQTLIGGTAVDNAVVLQGTSSAGNTATAIAAQIKVGDAGATNAVTVLNNGNVGIGNIAPAVALEISAPSGEALRIQDGAGNLVLRAGPDLRWVGVNDGNGGAALNIKRIANGSILKGSNNNVQRTVLENTGTQRWFLNNGVSEAGSVQYDTPTGDPGIIFYTGATYDLNRFDVVNAGTNFFFRYNANGAGSGININQGGNVGINTATPAAQHHIVSSAAARIAQIIQMPATPTANAQEIRNSAGTVLSATRPDGSWQPPQIADAAAVNNSLYYSTTLSKLVFKDPAGVVNPLY